MFKLHKQKSDKLGERFDFRLSNIQALKVPKGWDKLSVSIVSAETGKAVAKSAKVSVWNGGCQWTESFSESVWLPTYDDSKSIEGCILKVVVFTGSSSRSGLLGEATINLATFMSSRASFPLSLALKKCNHGTILQMKVQCLNPRVNTSEESGRDIVSSPEEATIDYDDIENKSDVSENLSRMSSGSASSNYMDTQFRSVESFSRETSFSASGSYNNFDLGEGSFSRGVFSPQRNPHSISTNITARQDSTSSNTSLGYDSPARSDKPSNSKNSRSRNSFQNESHRTSRTFMGSPLRNLSTSKELIETVEATVEEVRAEAGMWERNANRAMMDIENLQEKLSIELEQKEALAIELSASKKECDGLRLEIGELRVSLEEMNLKQSAKNGIDNLQKELEEEIKFLNESNTNLSVQLQKTQESNIELVSVLQEMEDIIEKQRKEIADLVKSEDKQGREGNHNQEMELIEPLNRVAKTIDEESISERNLKLEVKSLRLKVQELERDCQELTDENLQLLFKLKESQNNQVWDACSSTPVKGIPEDQVSGTQIRELEWRVCDLEKELSVKNGECLSLRESCTELELQLQTFRNMVSGTQIRELEWRVCDLEKELSMKNGECLSLRESCTELELQLQTFRNKVSQLDAEVHKSHLETEDWEIRFAELEQQLKDYKPQSQVQEMQDIIEKQRNEIADLLLIKSEYKHEHGERYDQEMKLHEPSNSIEENIDEESSSDRNLVLEIKSLKLKVQELEKDCHELTDENLQLLFKLKESQINTEDEVAMPQKTEPELRVCDLEKELSMKNGECSYLREKCSELEVQLHSLRDEVSQLDAKVHKYRAKTDDWKVRYAELEQQLEDYKSQREIIVVDEDPKSSSGSEASEMMKGTYFVTQNDQHEAVLNKLEDIRRLVEREDSNTKIMVGAEEENAVLTLDEQLSILYVTLESKLKDTRRELLDKTSEIDQIKAESVLNQEEIQVLRDGERELVSLFSKAEEEKSQLLLTNKALKGKSLELELNWSSLEDHLSELEKENVSLSERICGLEAQLRYLTDEREMNRLALQSSESCCLKLQDDVRDLESDLEAQKVDLRGKLIELQKQLLETKEECGYLRIANQKLEATADGVIEECSLLQKSNARLKAENLELNRNFMVLQAELKESKGAFDQLSVEIEVLLEKFDSVLEETSLKGKAIDAELDALILENKRINPGEKEISSSMSGNKLKNELCAAYEAKIRELMDKLSVYKQNQDILMAEREKLMSQIESFKLNEAKIKNHIRRVELKFKRSEYERAHLVEDISTLKDQLQKLELLQVEVLSLRRTLEEAKLENERLEASFQVLLGDYEETKLERDSFSEKISAMEISVRELQASGDRKIALEERVLRLEGDLTAREALYVEDAELKNELARIRTVNTQLQRRVQEHERRAVALEEELEQAKGAITNSGAPQPSTLQREEMHKEESPPDLQHRENEDGMGEGPLQKIRLLENELAEALEANNMYKDQLKSFPSGGGACVCPGSLGDEDYRARESILAGKVSSLENELRELQESYLHMSLKYAQGEADRETMMMRLKAL
ncbi:hypothetical protein SAY87_002656 [Trapa incisa]|uniref:C2 NT-type domain-containing protein n=1 Tax=Trapa incisa TaxID=236973 RepID=A0AAN7JWD3_9MYRT|nr:hypothetical protein SAY87_002656 [Trapa incisa]